MSEAFMADQDSSYAPMPHALALDPTVSPSAVRLWAVVHYRKWNRLEIEPQDLADAMQIGGVRSIFRWLAELEAGQWVVWNRHSANPMRRIVLRYGKQSPEAQTLEQIRTLLAEGSPTIEDIREIISQTGTEDEGSDQGGGGQESGNTASVNEWLKESATVGTSANSGSSANSGTCDPGGTSDPGGTCANTITFSATGGTESANTITFDDRAGLSDAENRISRDVGVGVTHGESADSPKETPTPRNQKPGRPARTTPPRQKTALENWLLDQDMLPTSARRFAHLDQNAAQKAFRDFMRDCPAEDRMKRIGSLVVAWTERPPQPEQPPQRPGQPLEWEAAEARAAELAPDAGRLDLGQLAADLAAGVPEDKAMQNHRERQLFAEHWSKVPAQRPGARP